jgi:hypothetical protein
MAFRNLFPVTTWCLGRMASASARRFYAWVFAFVFIPAVAMRIEAALHEGRILAMVNALSTLQIGTTSKSEALSKATVAQGDRFERRTVASELMTGPGRCLSNSRRNVQTSSCPMLSK